MNEGFIILHRQLLSWEWFDDSNTLHLWIYCLLRANSEECRWHGIVIPRGSFLTSLDKISKETSLTVRQIRTSTAKLKATGELTIKTTNKYSIVTICKYDSYNSLKTLSDKQNDKLVDKLIDKQNDKQATTNNNINNIDNNFIQEDKEKETKVSTKKKEVDELFEECWKAYRRKGSKKEAFEVWKKLTDAEKSVIPSHIKSYVSTRELQYQKDFQRYLSHKIFNTVVFQGNQAVYDPDIFSNSNEYKPITDGDHQWWNEKRKCLMFNGYIHMLNDGYTAETRPDGAKIAHNMYEWIWSKEKKEWIKQ